MALISTNQEYEKSFKKLSSPMECLMHFNQADTVEEKHHALDSLKNFQGGALVLLSILIDGEIDPRYTTYVASILSKTDLSSDLVDGLFSLLEFDNAHIRNLAVEILQNQGEKIEPFFDKYLKTSLRDTKILFSNVLGNTKLKKSRHYLLKMIEDETEANVVALCVEYLGDLGLPEDIETLLALKEKFIDNDYVVFSIENAIKEIKNL